MASGKLLDPTVITLHSSSFSQGNETVTVEYTGEAKAQTGVGRAEEPFLSILKRGGVCNDQNGTVTRELFPQRVRSQASSDNIWFHHPGQKCQKVAGCGIKKSRQLEPLGTFVSAHEIIES